MTEDAPRSFDPQQPDLPSLAVDPDPDGTPEEPQDTSLQPLDEDGSARP
ncbi:chromosome partitioning protein [Cellulomonas marina]|uniref:Uncharacterized protein n=1 Tax=Cellulomonas marina TaxID=988821 RepID=A0A1I1A0D1_9CELL|nr:chromosome partitioning protein [Cellulomonas marina]GIG29399.1 hypothetical protein Cma02nite_19990 [Cellulomonas marina]SFB29853.1 hypothetical protein SAMN05421867_11340 [Cellulomonas marina]